MDGPIRAPGSAQPQPPQAPHATPLGWVPMVALPVASFLVLAFATFVVGRQQVAHDERLLLARTRDVAVQTARHLQTSVGSGLTAASVFARRWSNHERRDFSYRRFKEFAPVLVAEIPGIHDVRLVPAEGGENWRARDDSDSAWEALGQQRDGLLDVSARESKPLVSAPLVVGPNRTRFFAALPLRRGPEYLGTLIVEFDSERLIGDGLQREIGTEFNFDVFDGDTLLFSHDPDGPQSHTGSIRAQQEFPIGNQTWVFTVSPRSSMLAGSGWHAVTPILLFGLVLSATLGVMLHLVMRRLRLYRLAHGRALREVAERERAQVRLAQLSRKILMAQEDERARLSRELHDELGQLLTAARLEIGWLRRQVALGKVNVLDASSQSIHLVEEAAEELRRICRGLRPPVLDDIGLEPAVIQLAREFRERTTIATELLVSLEDEDTRLSPEASLCIYRVLQESLNNVSRHAQAKRVEISLGASDDAMVLTVRDDGSGFDIGKLGEEGGGIGIEGMRERANLVNGKLTIESAPGKGTRVELRLPETGLRAAVGAAAATA